MNITITALEAVIEGLKEKFPDRLPKNITTTEEIHIRIGQQQVIRYLLEVWDKKNEN